MVSGRSTGTRRAPVRAMMPAPVAGRVLLVDDDALVLRSCTRTLQRAGLTVETADDAERALELVSTHRYDVIVSDLRMPGSTGLEVLQRARQHDATVPFVLITGNPDLDSAITAVNLGATGYLPKPFANEALLQAVLEGVRRRGTEASLAGANARLDAALQGLWMAYQPIVSWARRGPHAYEALLRTTAPGIRGPGDVLALAEQTRRLFELGRHTRNRAAQDLAQLDPDVLLFVNLHPADLEDPELYAPHAPLSAFAHRVVLELTERASVTHDETLDEHLRALHALGYRLAVDDLGEGYAGLTTLARVRPEYVKLDGSLVRGLGQSRANRAIISGVMSMAEELDMRVIAEAIETPEELASLRALGVDFLQGYLFARPARPFCGVDPAPFGTSSDAGVGAPVALCH